MAEKEQKKICAYCDNYMPQIWSQYTGVCRAIPGEKRGQRGKKVMYDMDASGCPKFVEKPDAIPADWVQGGFDVEHTRVVLPGEEAPKSDRLVWEKHEKEKEEK